LAKAFYKYGKIGPAIFLLSFFSSCTTGPADIPLPSEYEFPQPVKVALHFTDSSVLKWPDHFKTFKPIIQKFDFNKLPSKIFDSSVFIAFSKKPEEVRFNWQQLKDTVFNYEKLPSKPLRFERLMGEPPKLMRAPRPFLKKGSAAMVYEFGDLEGLIGNSITALLQDRNGMIWVSTDKGVFQYDGENFTRYIQISREWNVVCMLEDAKGNIWIGTGSNNDNDGRGIFIIDKKTNQIRHLSTTQGLDGNIILDMQADQAGRIWLSIFLYNGNHQVGIDIIDERESQIKHFDVSRGLSLDNVRNLLQDSKGNLWITTRGGGINIIDPKKGKIKYLRKDNGLLNDSLTNMVEDADGRIWISTRRGYMNRVDVKQGVITQYGAEQGLHLNYTGSLLSNRLGEIWIATCNLNGDLPGNGIEIIDPAKGAIRYVTTSAGLNSNDLYQVLQDTLGQIWAATFNGLCFLNKGGSEINHFGTNEITAITEDATGKIWVANGFNKGVHGVEILDTKTGISRSLNTAHGLINDSLQTIFFHKGKIWIATNGGVDVLDSASNTIEHLGGKDILDSANPTSIFISDEGKLWMGNASDGNISIIDVDKNTLGHLIPSIHERDTAVTDIKQDRLGRIWMSTNTGGVYMISADKKLIKYIGIKTLSGSRTNKFLLPDNQNNIWITTGKGIFIVNSACDSITHITMREGLPGDDVISLNRYKDRIYAGTLSGIAVITPPDLPGETMWNIKSFGKHEGINKQGKTVASDFVTRDGVFLWGDNGLTTIREKTDSNSAPRTYITGLDIFNQPQYFVEKSRNESDKKDTVWTFKKDTFYISDKVNSNRLFPQQDKMQWDSISDAYNLPVNLQLPYYQNYLQFHFNQANLGSRDTTWYRYILLGADKKWSAKTYNSFSQNYLNLAAGEYIFKVSGMYNGKWNEPAAFRFTVRPPWWQTWWAYALDIMVIGGIAWTFARYRSRKLKKENLILEEKIASRTAELQQSLEELKNTQTQLIQSEKMASLGELTAGIAHEIQNPLNFVNNFSEVNLEMNSELREKLNSLSLEGKDKT